MDKFPDWAQRVLGKGVERDQVSSGLNLALKLESPAKLPLLLWDIVAAQPKITRALQELSFVHYARFVPSWDGRALMVTTSFDGPLEPYVMDFVIALGDVFDTLLSYVDKKIRPRLPIRNHPEEFWAFVKHWNRVPFAPRIGNEDTTLFPPDFNFPLYSAYPRQTVTDIDGMRQKLPPPVIDHPAAPVDLADVQGNILRGYRADRAVHLFFKVVDVMAARKWLATILPNSAAGGGAEWLGIRSGASWGSNKPHVMTNVAFTYAGMVALLPDRKNDLQKFPLAFREGAHRRAERNGDTGESSPETWRFGRDEQQIHVVLSLYAFDTKAQAAANAAAQGIFTPVRTLLETAASANGMKLVDYQPAQALPEGREYFGYRDGISKPRIAGQCKPDDPDFQPAASPGEFLLGREYMSVFGGPSIGDMPEDLARNGTFAAMRLLEQDVALFDKTITSEAARLKIADKNELKAKLMGRWPDGKPLSLDPPGAPVSGGPTNEFDYAPSWAHPDVDNDHFGARCPVGAHIRRANPRTARVAGQRHSRRLIRRGMPSTWKNAEGKEQFGLLGLFIGASLERQFEFIQREWIQGDLAASGIRHTQDPVVGLRSKPTVLRLSPDKEVTLPPFVRTRGSLYLFFPSLSTLRGLDRAASASIFRRIEDESEALQQLDNAREAVEAVGRAELAELWSLPSSIIELVRALLLEDSLESDVVRAFVDHFTTLPRGAFGPSNPLPGGIKPLDPRFIADPFPAYQALRKKGTAIVWVPEHEAYWVLTRRAAEVLFDHKRFIQQPSTKTLRGLLTMDEPRHAVARPIVGQAFKVATQRLAAITDEVVSRTLKRLGQLHQFDFVQEYGNVVPKAVYWRIFGLPDDEIPRCDALAQTVMLHYGQPARPGVGDNVASIDASVRLAGRIALHLAKALLASHGDGGRYAGTLIGEIAACTKPGFGSGRKLEFVESLMTLIQLALVHMSSQFLLGSAMRHLLTPDVRPGKNGEVPWTTLADLYANNKQNFEPVLRRAIEEARRVDPPVTIVERFAALDQDIAGIYVKKDSPVFVVIASANRDDVVGGEPEEFHFDREPAVAHLSLGYGIHECAGKLLQEQLVSQALTRLIAEMPRLQLCDTTSMPAWIDNIYFRALQSLPVSRCLDGISSNGTDTTWRL